MKINAVGVVTFLLGIIITYSAVKDFDPRDVIKNALGGPAPQKQTPGSSSNGAGGALGGLPGAVKGAVGKAASGVHNALGGSGTSQPHGGPLGTLQDSRHKTAVNFDKIRHSIASAAHAGANLFDKARHGVASFFGHLFGR